MPNVPVFVEGIINLREDIIPVINLKKKFNMKEWEVQENSRIIIINIDNRQIGIVVDDASEVVNLHQKYIDDSPDIAMNIDEKYIMGIGRMDEEVIILLDLTELLFIGEKNVN
ncbi:chemotaxis protein CheW [Anaeromonas gelatinilytica]|uniref:chemotaxis protein CheW n=1 Tax=Anaeromonas gelatinilytica TaxID=2683194 RepID=UPI00331527E3